MKRRLRKALAHMLFAAGYPMVIAGMWAATMVGIRYGGLNGVLYCLWPFNVPEISPPIGQLVSGIWLGLAMIGAGHYIFEE